jgi:lipoprotein-releasing system permease protein
MALACGTAYLWWLHLGERRDLEGARLAASLVLGVRLGIRALPRVLDQIEKLGFESLVAARMLRAKKSGFLAAIGGLSILAVTVSSCALTTTLSVMGGFRQDLKRKILGNNAHIVIDRENDTIADYARLVDFARGEPDVEGVSPFVAGEVMISSASNLAGAVLRGIDPAHIGDVSELPSNMRVGALDYLVHPEKLTRLSGSQLSLGVGGPKVTRQRVADDAPDPKNSRLLDDIERMLDRADDLVEKLDVEPKKPEPAADTKPDVLPGIIVGQELARSLRLYLGDEVNVVTPLGELGPTGPMPKARPFRVAGIFYSGMYEYDMKFAYVTLASAQRFLGAADTISGVEVTVREPERAQDVAQKLAAGTPAQGLRVRPWQELNKNLFGALALEKLAMFIALGIAILVASFCIVGTLTLMVQEKGREVGVLKAMGAADRAIVMVFVLEGMLIGLFGSLLGLALGYVMCFAAEHFGVKLNPEVYYIDRLPVHIDPGEFLAVGFSAVAVCLVVTIYPALLASRLRPVDALRYE